jgi:hypothetical protein
LAIAGLKNISSITIKIFVRLENFLLLSHRKNDKNFRLKKKDNMYRCFSDNLQMNQVFTWFGMIFETDRQLQTSIIIKINQSRKRYIIFQYNTGLKEFHGIKFITPGNFFSYHIDTFLRRKFL